MHMESLLGFVNVSVPVYVMNGSVKELSLHNP